MPPRLRTARPLPRRSSANTLPPTFRAISWVFTGGSLDGSRTYYSAHRAIEPEAQLKRELERTRALGYDLMGAHLGTLEPGKLADLVAVEGNPLVDIDDLWRTRFTMLNGVVYDRASLLRRP